MRPALPFGLFRAIAALAVFAVCTATGPADAAFETAVPYAILINSETGAVLFEKDADKLTPPAS